LVNEHEFCRHDLLYDTDLAEIDPGRNEYYLRRKNAHIQAGKDIAKAKIHIDDLCKTLRFQGCHVKSLKKLLDYTEHFVSISWTEFDWRSYERKCRAVSDYAINALENLTIS